MLTYFNQSFEKLKFSAIDGMTKVSFAATAPSPEPFTVTASPTGVRLHGKMIGELSDRETLNDFARLIADAWKEHQKLAPTIHHPGDFKP